ncbi:hypothetical protein [Sediminibacterium sp.]|uniref:hypothetical protein n=1 Tax=Sediminibacterium sp. TaxID=1917865 RepID=UPI003F72EDA9
MKKLLVTFLLIVCFSSCDSLDDRTSVAKEAVKEIYNNPKRFPAHMVGFQKTDGENFESKIIFEPGVHQLYKLFYTAEYEVDVDGFTMENKKNASTYPTIFNERNKGLDHDENGNFIYQNFGYSIKRDIKKGDRFYIKSYVILRKKENTWEYIPE